MSKLRDILAAHFGDNMPVSLDMATEDIRKLFLELIGEDEPVKSQHYYVGEIEERTAFPDRRNRLRAELRRKVSEV